MKKINLNSILEETQIRRKLTVILSEKSYSPAKDLEAYVQSHCNAFYYNKRLSQHLYNEWVSLLSDAQGSLLILDQADKFKPVELAAVLAIKKRFPDIGVCVLGTEIFQYRLKYMITEEILCFEKNVDIFIRMYEPKKLAELELTPE